MVRLSGMSILTELSSVVGSDNVIIDPEVLLRYSYDASECLSRLPDVVALPSCTEEVIGVMKIANRLRESVTPVVSCTNGWGQHIPLKGGLVLDLSRMSQIQIDERMRYVVIGAGATVQAVIKALGQKGMWASVPKACPGNASLLVNLLIQGVGFMPLKFGSQYEQINGLEVVLPDGELLRCGSTSCSPYWFGRVPLPDLVGLFSGWFGSTGVVTKVSLPIYRKPLHVEAFCLRISTPQKGSFGPFLSSLVDLDVADDISAYSPDVGFVGNDTKLTSGRETGVYLYAIVTGSSKNLVDAKIEILNDLVEKQAPKNMNVSVLELTRRDRDKYLQLPDLRTSFNPDVFGGSTNPACYIPISAWAQTMQEVQRTCRRFGRESLFRVDVFRGSHSGSLMTYLRFNRKDENEVKKITSLVRDIVEIYVKKGGLVWKAPPWAWSRQIREANMGFLKSLKMIKRTLDPNRIMSPGRLGFEVNDLRD